MVKKVIGFICEVDRPFTNDTLNEGCGGAETWVINIAKEFETHGYHVIIFNNIGYHIFYNDIEYVPISYLYNRLSYQNFDCIFIMRYYNSATIDYIKESNCCDTIWLVAHDVNLWHSKFGEFVIGKSSVSYNDDILNDSWAKTHIKGLLVMSEWHKQQNLIFYPESFIKVIGNGIDINDFSESNNERDNSILWSSCYERGIDILIKKIAPYIIEKIPDFKVYCCCYNDNLDERLKEYSYVVDLHSLPKKELYKEMAKHKVWFLPLMYWETFCITTIEEIYSDVEIVLPYKYGVQTTLGIFKDMLLDEQISIDNEDTYKEIANIIIERIANYNNNDRKLLRNIMKNYVKANYSWSAIYDKLISTIKI